MVSHARQTGTFLLCRHFGTLLGMATLATMQAKVAKEARPKWAGFKSMADYGAGPVLLDHGKNREIKTAGRRLIKNRKLPVWMGASESAP